jgi:hypothetical protein
MGLRWDTPTDERLYNAFGAKARRWIEAPLPCWAWGVGGFVCGFATCFLALVP